MENNDQKSYDDILWNKYDYIHKRLGEKYLYYQNVIKYFSEIKSEIEKHFIGLALIDNQIKLKLPENFDELFNLFKESIKLFLENHKKYINKIVNSIDKYLSEVKKVTIIYVEFKQSCNNYHNQQKKFNQIKGKFQESALHAESKTLEKLKKNNEKKPNEEIELSNKLKKEVKFNLEKYQSSLEEINKVREEYNSKPRNIN